MLDVYLLSFCLFDPLWLKECFAYDSSLTISANKISPSQVD